ncbi:carboxypeptidase regulatory-like domain-containing protein [Candidatus Sumerlaeota bacterium]|nr:carboxypeptidase regulatory-like domain-containing protein [Candidatus Sumerlaeota bacterium]
MNSIVTRYVLYSTTILILGAALAPCPPAFCQSTSDPTVVNDHSAARLRQKMDAEMNRYQQAIQAGEMEKARAIYRNEYCEDYKKLYGKYPDGYDGKPSGGGTQPQKVTEVDWTDDTGDAGGVTDVVEEPITVVVSAQVAGSPPVRSTIRTTVPQKPGVVAINGRVVDQDGQGIVGATVTLGDGSTVWRTGRSIDEGRYGIGYPWGGPGEAFARAGVDLKIAQPRPIVITMEADDYAPKTVRIDRPDTEEPMFARVGGIVRDSVSKYGIDGARVTLQCGSKKKTLKAEGGGFFIELDGRGTGEPYSESNAEYFLDRSFTTTVRAHAIGYMTDSQTYTFPYAEMPNVVTIHGVVHCGEPIPGAEVTMDLWGGDVATVTTDAEGRFEISATPFLKNPKRPDYREERNFALSPSSRLTARMEYRPVHFETSAFGGHAAILPNVEVPATVWLEDIRIDRVPLISGEIFTAQTGFFKGERKIDYVDWRGGPSNLAKVSDGRGQFTLVPPRVGRPSAESQFDPEKEFPVLGRLHLKYIDPATKETFEGDVEYIIPSPIPIVKVEAPKFVLDDGEVDLSKTFRVQIADWNEARSLDVSVKGNGDVFFYNPDTRQMEESFGVPFACFDPDGAWPTNVVVTFAFKPNKRMMNLTEYLEASGVDSSQLEQSLTYLAGETMTYPDFIEKMSSVAPNAPHYYSAGKYTKAALGNLDTFVKNNPKVGPKIMSFLKENSHLKSAPGIVAGAISHGELILTVVQAAGNEKLLQRIGRFELGEDFAEVNETVTTGADFWVGFTDCAMFWSYSATWQVHVGWQVLKGLYAYGKYQNDRVAKYDELCKSYESFVYEPILIVVRDSEGNEVTKTTQAMVKVTKPEAE